MLKWTMIAAGGAAGTLLRYAVSGLVQRWGGETFPFGTLVVNSIGCLLIGFIGGVVLTGTVLWREEYQAAVMIGLLGGLTTFSSFGWESLSLARDGQLGWAMGNIALNNGIGLLAVWIGYRAAVATQGV